MPLSKLINRPCTIHRRVPSEERDAQGNEVAGTNDVETVCELQQLAREEGAEEVTETRWAIFFLAGTEIGSGDEVTVPDEGRFKIDGKPDHKRNPRTQQMAQVEATACLVAGAEDEEVGS